MSQNPIAQLMATNPGLEVWWDSSPLVFNKWVQEMLGKAAPGRRSELEGQLREFLNLDDMASSLAAGCTTNPPLSLIAVQSDPEFWSAWVDNLIRTQPDLTQKQVFWTTYKEVVQRGARMFMPMFEATNGRHGWLSGQLDPRLSSDYDQMVMDAKDLRSLSPNVMIKVPATSTGMKVLRTITAMGYSTNVTTCFTMPQIMAAADAVMAGIADAKKNGVDVSKWRSVITMMIGRLTENKALVDQAKRRGIELTWSDLHWFGVAVFRRAYQTLMDNGYLSKMLACSVRPGPQVAGRERYWDIEKIAGGEIVYTLPPAALGPLWDVADQMHFRPEINEPVPQSILDKFSKIPYAIQSYDPNGMEIDQFDMHPATIHTLESFSQATAGLEKYVGERMALVKGK